MPASNPESHLFPPETWFVERLLWFRNRAWMSQKQLARAAGVSLQTVKSWEQGKGLPRPSSFPALCAALGLTPLEASELRQVIEAERVARSAGL